MPTTPSNTKTITLSLPSEIEDEVQAVMREKGRLRINAP